METQLLGCLNEEIREGLRTSRRELWESGVYGLRSRGPQVGRGTTSVAA